MLYWLTLLLYRYLLSASNKFSAMIDDIGLQQPAWKELTTTESALDFATEGELFETVDGADSMALFFVLSFGFCRFLLLHAQVFA